MTIYRNIGSLLNNSFSQWPLVVAFISGIVFTAGIANVFGLDGETTPKEPVIPVPQNAPGQMDPGFYQHYNPAYFGTSKLA